MSRISGKILAITLLMSSLFGRDFNQEFGASFKSKGGNTDYNYYHFDYKVEAVGNLTFGSLILKDTEFIVALKHSKSELNKHPYENDASGLIKIDLWANGKVSPFLYSEVSFDSTKGLDNRINFGAGLKYSIIEKLISLSYAFIYENEKFKGWPGKNFSRHSFRPKLKKKFESGFFIQSQVFYKPTTDFKQYLLDWQTNLAIPTKAEWLSITLNYMYQFNSHPAILSFSTDNNDRVVPLSHYKNEDRNLTIGVSISF